ncbi:uncharacterized protein LOC126851480 [Cataglyphis hispanica]|uniref:uncharacterized protein LOC126851480 n=1 Tax=Cataglyphis hispanica TaxID=1086592 RepID=UPI0021805024|nr:uncharacterized protein LOC126851480 [Cataglyphis hispanica]XP_050451473.1 uncharacterized protein LOC126851480 [Cataglyphis hispanica]
MTLHWWMHWFWVTAQFLVILGNPLPSTTSDPVNQPQPSSRTTSPSTEDIYRSSKPARPSFRIAKAIGLYPQTNTAVVADRQQPVTTVVSSLLEPRESNGLGTIGHEAINESSFHGNISDVVPVGVTTPAQRIIERFRNPTTKKDSKVTWILTTSKSSGRPKYDQEERYNQSSGTGRNVSFDEAEDLTVLPLQEEMNKADLSLNRTRSSLVTSLSAAGVTGNAAIRTFNRSEDEVEIDEEVAQTQHFATAASILEVGVSEATRQSRTRNTFITQHFQRDQMQGDNRSSDYIDTDNSNRAEQQSLGTSAAGIAAITGSCLATVALLSTMGSLGFIIYRRKYLNPPQTLNSDKCSNPDSSGYIDDSTIRDNSEEMYSLDNDSFLNSLEAMTIQNYWTDSVKHTKL